MRLMVRALTTFFLTLLLAASVCAQQAPASKPAGVDTTGDDVTLTIFNRPVVVFRSSFLGTSLKARADRARFSINQALEKGGPLVVSVKGNSEGQLVLIDDQLAFVVTGADADPLRQEDAKAAAGKAARQLEQIIAETREARDLRSMLKALAVAGVASLVFAALVALVMRLRVGLDRLLVSSLESRVRNLKLGGTQLVEMHQLVPSLQRLLNGLRWAVILLLAYEWLSFVLSAFPYTRSWGERLNDYLLDVIGGILNSILGAIPGLGVALSIFLVARLFIGFLGRVLERLVRSGTPISWLSPQTMPTSRRCLATSRGFISCSLPPRSL